MTPGQSGSILEFRDSLEFHDEIRPACSPSPSCVHFRLGLYSGGVTCVWSVDRLHSQCPENCLLATLQAQAYASPWKGRLGEGACTDPRSSSGLFGQGTDISSWPHTVLTWEGPGPRTVRAGASPAYVWGLLPMWRFHDVKFLGLAFRYLWYLGTICYLILGPKSSIWDKDITSKLGNSERGIRGALLGC